MRRSFEEKEISDLRFGISNEEHWRALRAGAIQKALRLAAGAATVGVALLMLAGTAMAQEGQASPEDSAIGWVVKWLNFAIVFGGIAYLVVKSGGPAFRARAEKISAAIGEAARAREAAEAQRRETQQKLANLAKEVEEMRAAAKRDAAAEAQRLREMAKAEAQKIERAAQAEIAAAERAARLELKQIGARLAVEGAAAVLRKELTAQSESQLFRAFVAELERNPN
jgi:F-type H+-transporting ATPase subunit b